MIYVYNDLTGNNFQNMKPSCVSNHYKGTSKWQIKKAIVTRDLWENNEIKDVLEIINKNGPENRVVKQPKSEIAVIKTDDENECEPSLNKMPRLTNDLTFRMTCRCTGRIGRKIDPMDLQRDLGFGLKKLLDWKVNLRSPDIEVSVHVSDDGVVVGIPVTRSPISKRSYIQHFGLRSTIAYIMSSLLPLKAGDVVLDPMCGKATILVESAYTNKSVSFYGCDKDLNQLKSATDNVNFNNLNNVNILQGDATGVPLHSSSVDHIVCDAPFGNKFVVETEMKEFYSNLLNEFSRLLKPKGRIVLLTSQEIHQFISQLFLREENLIKTKCDHDNKIDYLDISCCSVEKNYREYRDNINKTCSSSDTITSSKSPPCKTCSSSDTITSSKIPPCTCNNCNENTCRKDSCENALSSDVSILVPHDSSTSGNNVNKLKFCNSLTFVESHYVKLGETHAYICVFDKT